MFSSNSTRTQQHRVTKVHVRNNTAKKTPFSKGFVFKISLAASFLFYLLGFLYWFTFGTFRMLPYGIPAIVAGRMLAGFGLFVFSGKDKPHCSTWEVMDACTHIGISAFIVAGFAEFLTRVLGLSGYQELGVLAVCLMTANLTARIILILIQRRQPVPPLFPSGF